MARHPEGAALIAEYYAVAPEIVAAIPAAHPDWAWIEGRIDRAVAEIRDDRPEAALATYCGMVRRLMTDWFPPDSFTPAPRGAAPAVADRSQPL